MYDQVTCYHNTAHGAVLSSGAEDFVLPAHTVLKIYRDNHLSRMKNEVDCLSRLSDYEWFPKILHVGPNFIVMDYCGELLDASNCPDDWMEQVKEIEEILKKMHVNHGDSAGKNFCVLNGRLRLIDFSCGAHIHHHKRINNQYLAKMVEKMIKTDSNKTSKKK
jgi:tRNA A-37 threonylcarbamoyl transferase component Bud32